MQSLACARHQQVGMVTVMRNMVAEEGLFRPIKGMNAMALGAGPAHAMYFTALEKSKDFFMLKGVSEHLSSGAAAVTATMLHDAVMTPADGTFHKKVLSHSTSQLPPLLFFIAVVKQRMQMCCSPYATCTQAATSIYQNEGLRAFYRSYATQLTMNVPFQAAMFVTYGAVQNALNPEKVYNPYVHFLAGAIAGSVGSAVTMPLDVCKTLLNTQEAGVLKQLGRTEVVGLVGAAQVVNEVQGFRGFFQGLTARVLYQAPSTAVAWSVYELFKYLLHSKEVAKAKATDDQYETLSDLKKLAPPPAVITGQNPVPGVSVPGVSVPGVSSVSVPAVNVSAGVVAAASTE